MRLKYPIRLAIRPINVVTHWWTYLLTDDAMLDDTSGWGKMFQYVDSADDLETAPRCRRDVVLHTLEQAAEVKRRIRKPVLSYPCKLYWLAMSPCDAICDKRRGISKELLAARSTDDLDGCATVLFLLSAGPPAYLPMVSAFRVTF